MPFKLSRLDTSSGRIKVVLLMPEGFEVELSGERLFSSPESVAADLEQWVEAHMTKAVMACGSRKAPTGILQELGGFRDGERENAAGKQSGDGGSGYRLPRAGR